MTDLNMRRGDTQYLDFTIVDADGAAVNLTGCDLWFTAKYSFDDLDAAAVFEKQLLDGITIVDSAEGTCTVTISSTDWNAYTPPENLVWDFQVKTGGGTVTTTDSGRIWVEQDVTKDII